MGSVAAGLAWLDATEVIGHERPFFALIAALISLGVTHNQRLWRAAELMIGVAVGIAVADLLIAVLGSGAWRIAVVVALSMALAVRADYALRNVGVLARRALAALREGEALAPELPDRLDDLAGAAELLRDELDRSAEPDAARAALLATAAGCGDPLLVDAGFSGRVVVAQLCSVVLDLLQATGTPRADAVAVLPGSHPPETWN